MYLSLLFSASRRLCKTLCNDIVNAKISGEGIFQDVTMDCEGVRIPGSQEVMTEARGLECI